MIGNYLKTEIKKLQQKYRVIGDVRGQGMMIGIEYVENQ